MSNKRYPFEPNSEVADWIDENITNPSGIGWTAFCYESIDNAKRKVSQYYFDRVATRITIILAGMIIISLSFISQIIVIFILILISGFFIIILGFSMLYLEVRNGRRNRA